MVGWWRWRSSERAVRRWVVVDVETTGLHATVDELISIGGVAMFDGHVVPADSIEIIVKKTAASSRDNILVHGIGAQAQLSGTDPRDAMREFMNFIGPDPLIAFHAPFDRKFLARAIKSYINLPFDNPWLDLAELAPVLCPKAGEQSLDEWLQRYGISLASRHNAAADAFATALLVARLLPEAKRQGAGDYFAMRRLTRHARWLR
jgi:DNA polymerase III subunit epsilon